MSILETNELGSNILDRIGFYITVEIEKPRLISFEIDFIQFLLKIEELFINSVALLQKVIWQRFSRHFLFFFGGSFLKCLALNEYSVAWCYHKYLKWGWVGGSCIISSSILQVCQLLKIVKKKHHNILCEKCQKIMGTFSKITNVSTTANKNIFRKIFQKAFSKLIQWTKESCFNTIFSFLTYSHWSTSSGNSLSSFWVKVRTY